MKRNKEWKTVKIDIVGQKPYIKSKPQGVRLEITNLDVEWTKIKTKVYVASKKMEDDEYII